MKDENKFEEGASPFYPGATSKAIQKLLNGLMNKSIDDIISVLKTNPTKGKILQQYKAPYNSRCSGSLGAENG